MTPWSDPSIFLNERPLSGAASSIVYARDGRLAERLLLAVSGRSAFGLVPGKADAEMCRAPFDSFRSVCPTYPNAGWAVGATLLHLPAVSFKLP